MGKVVNTVGKQGFNCGEFSVRAEIPSVDGDLEEPKVARVALSADGPDEGGHIQLNANGRIGANVEAASLEIVPKGVVIDGGDLGNVGLRSGTAPAQQSISVEGNGKSVLVKNGQLPISPTIDVGVDSITLSVGPSKITIGPLGIVISGPKVEMNGELEAAVSAPKVDVSADVMASVSGADVQVAAQASVVVKGNATAELSAAGQTSVKGGMVMVN